MQYYTCRHRGVYSKATKQYSAKNVKEAKRYDYINGLIVEVINKRELGVVGVERLDAKVKRSKDDPRNIQPRTAKVPKPTMEKLISDKKEKSRFNLTDLE